MRGLPGLQLGGTGDDEVWLRLERLLEIKPPQPENPVLALWIDLPSHPEKEPTLKADVALHELVTIGAMNPATLSEADESKDEQDKTEEITRRVQLNGFSGRHELESSLKAYTELVWKKWSTKETARRKSIKLYSNLFTLFQQLQGNLVDAQLELVWGIGVAVCSDSEGEVKYPLIAQFVEVMLNERDMSLEIRPRSVEPQLEVQVFEAQNNSGVVRLGEAAKQFFEGIGNIVSPFEPSTFEGLLRSAATFLDVKGSYWPDETTADDRSLPSTTDHLIVTDTWALFARPRSNNQFEVDLRRFRSKLNEIQELPPAVAALVTDPSTVLEDEVLPPFRGMSFVEGHGETIPNAHGKVQELYFPLPYNDEQVQIIQRLEAHDGVVVQGPPGTGKTHTIANVICHYLALGKRVLVTSMKDPALGVLRDKIPEEIRPLAISLLTSELQGMKQFEFAINRIAAEIQQIDRAAYKRDIANIEGQIEGFHAALARTDREISHWARKNIEPFSMDGESFRPEDAAKRVLSNQGEFEWLSDPLTISEAHRPQMTNAEIVQLREARLAVGTYLVYFGKRIPLVSAFPETPKLIQLHQDLVHMEALKRREIDVGVPKLVKSEQTTLESAMQLADTLSELLKRLNDLSEVNEHWVGELKIYLRKHRATGLSNDLADLIADIDAPLFARKSFLRRPVTLPEDMDRDDDLVEAVANLSKGKSPFGLGGMFGKGEQKRILGRVEVMAEAPKTPEDWAHVLGFIKLQKAFRTLLARWNAIAGEIPLPKLGTSPEHILQAGQAIEAYKVILELLDKESEVMRDLAAIMPSWTDVSRIPQEPNLLSMAKDFLNHHLTHYRLAETWAVKDSFQRALSGCEGEITQRIRGFLDRVLGKQAVLSSEIQSVWSSLMEELRVLHEKSTQLQTIQRITGLIEASGAPIWAKQLRTQAWQGVQDELLPDHWADAWRLKRLATHLMGIDSQAELKRLFDLRFTSENNLAKAYQKAIEKRTWLNIKEKASPSVQSALKGYLTAIKNIGKGTGVKAAQFRHNARVAADQANIAVPCWIMPHYRVSESLPSSFGLFDLVIIDEASQSDLSALPAILRAQKVLIVGDDKQASPEGVGLDNQVIANIMARYLSKQVPLYRPQMRPDSSIYDLFLVVFAKSAVMLKEHFRCVAPIIEYSKREFYNNELRPLRLPKVSERLDPPLIDVFVQDGFRKGKQNPAEARFIVDEIRRIVEEPAFAQRSIGVVSLLGAEQALLIMEKLNETLGEEIITRHAIACGDAPTFQGKERDIMFLSMVAVSGNAHALARDSYARRFNVAASRARDRMYLVRSIELEELSPADTHRASLIQHFQAPFAQELREVKSLRELCESPFECEVFDILTQRGYRVIPQVPAGGFRIDMVVEGDNDHRLAIECDGDQYHGADQWDADMRRQRILERAGWRFWRSFASTFVMRREEVIQDLLDTLSSHGIQPASADRGYKSIHVETRRISVFQDGVDAPQVEPDSFEETIMTEDAQEVFELVSPEPEPTKAHKPDQSTLQFNADPQ